MQPRFRIVVTLIALILISNGLFGITLAAPPELPDSTPVVIAEDKTREADCRSWVGSPANERPCQPGSVIFARRTTYGEAKQLGIRDYAILTQDSEKDQKLEDKLVTKVRHDIVGKPLATNSIRLSAACIDKWFWVASSYLSNPNDPGSARISWEMQYHRRADCSITDIVDRGRVNVSSYIWWMSCVNADLDCTNRGIIMDNIDWQPRPPNWKGMAFNSFQGKEYRHVAERPCSYCYRPYGWWKFND